MTTTAYATSTGYVYVITTGMPSEAVLVGEGADLASALKNREATPVQSAGSWPRERDLAVIARACGADAAELEDACGDGEDVAKAATYSIDCGIHRSVLAARGDVDGHPTMHAALAALAAVCADEPVAVDVGDGTWLVYASEEDAHGDDEGIDAIATIRKVAT